MKPSVDFLRNSLLLKSFPTPVEVHPPTGSNRTLIDNIVHTDNVVDNSKYCSSFVKTSSNYFGDRKIYEHLHQAMLFCDVVPVGLTCQTVIWLAVDIKQFAVNVHSVAPHL